MSAEAQLRDHFEHKILPRLRPAIAQADDGEPMALLAALGYLEDLAELLAMGEISPVHPADRNAVLCILRAARQGYDADDAPPIAGTAAEDWLELEREAQA